MPRHRSHEGHSRKTPRLDEPVAVASQELNELRETVSTLYGRVALLDAVIQSLPIWITVKDTQGRYLLVNEAMAKASDLDAVAFVGKTAREILRLEQGELDALDTLANIALTQNKPIERPSYVAKLPDGSEQVRRMIKLPLHDSDGDTLGVIGWSEDITQRMQAEAALDSNRRLLQSLFEVMPHALSYTGRDRKLRMVNRAWCETVGANRDQAIGRTILEIDQLPREVRQSLWDEGTYIFETGTAHPVIEYSLPDRRGGLRILQVSKAPLLARDEVEGFVTLSIDVTDLRMAEHQAKVASQRLNDALESIPASIYLYDDKDRLIMANTMAKSMNPEIPELFVPGTSFTQLVTAVARRLFTGAQEQAEFVERRLREFRHIIRQVEQPGPGGQYLIGHDRRTTEGGTVSIRFDISEQKRIQAELEQRERQTRRDLMLAAELQRNILQEVKPPPFLAEVHEFRPSSFVSGDVFHAATARDGSFLFFIGDATGHGVSAALITMLVEATLTPMPDDLPLNQMAEQLNARLIAYRLEGMYVSGIFLRVAADGQMAFCNAGHPTGQVAGNGGLLPLESSGPPMGWFESPGYEQGTTQLTPGDKIVLLTDGLTESANAAGEEFGPAAVARTVEEQTGNSAKSLFEALLGAAQVHGEGEQLADDLTLFVFEYRPPPA